MTRQVAYKGRQLISGLKLFATVYKTLKKKSSLISILHSVSPVQVYNIGQLVFCLQPSTYVSPHKHLQHEAEAIQEERVTRAAIFKRLACNSSIWFDLSHHLPATWPSLTLWLMGLMMFEVGDAARDHCQNDHRCHQCLVLALRYSMNIPAEKPSVRF